MASCKQHGETKNQSDQWPWYRVPQVTEFFQKKFLFDTRMFDIF